MILFILKKFYDYNGHAQITNGLKTSASFVVDMLNHEGHTAKLVDAVDGNCIDRLVTKYKPRTVILEALWVTPSKLHELRRLHHHVRWIVRIHSEIPFLSNEGISMDWLAAYVRIGVEVAFNSKQTQEDFEVIAKSLYLPNYYPLRKIRYPHNKNGRLDIGCFGAIRPLKNQLIQCLAAIKFAKLHKIKLHFHMNGTRQEQGGNNNLKAIQGALTATGNELILHDWMAHDLFLDLVQKMDFCLQVSLSESFNITASDAVSVGVPLIGSSAIRWLPKRSQAPVDSVAGIADKMELADHTTVLMNHAYLESYVHHAAEVWNKFAD